MAPRRFPQGAAGEAALHAAAPVLVARHVGAGVDVEGRRRVVLPQPAVPLHPRIAILVELLLVLGANRHRIIQATSKPARWRVLESLLVAVRVLDALPRTALTEGPHCRAGQHLRPRMLLLADQVPLGLNVDVLAGSPPVVVHALPHGLGPKVLGPGLHLAGVEGPLGDPPGVWDFVGLEADVRGNGQPSLLADRQRLPLVVHECLV
mmetsp:Transcript_45396/g.130201  ORF Transcript_45396/g.130201 Transcript_45396/m.130201 type:complete len:207 (+) Transcript_45396:374-994(+)